PDVFDAVMTLILLPQHLIRLIQTTLYTHDYAAPFSNLLPEPHDHLYHHTTFDRHALHSCFQPAADAGRYFAAHLSDVHRHCHGPRERAWSPRSHQSGELLVGTRCIASKHGTVHKLSQDAPVASRTYKHSRTRS